MTSCFDFVRRVSRKPTPTIANPTHANAKLGGLRAEPLGAGIKLSYGIATMSSNPTTTIAHPERYIRLRSMMAESAPSKINMLCEASHVQSLNREKSKA